MSAKLLLAALAILAGYVLLGLLWLAVEGATSLGALLFFALGLPVVLHFLQSGEVPRLPTALLATGLVLASSLSFVCGLVLEQVARGRKELKRLAYLSIPAVGAGE